MPNTVLVVGADPAQRQPLDNIIEFLDYTPVIVEDFEAWRDKPSVEPSLIHMVLLGHNGGEPALVEALQFLKEWAPAVPIFYLVGAGQIPHSHPELTTSTLGTLGFPIKSVQINYALHQAQTYHDSHDPAASRRPLEVFRSLVGNSRAMQQVRQLIEQVADSDTSVLILGESGTGKEVVARTLHYRSARRDKNFVPVNCGAIPGDLLESELFGHEKGAFTGAISARQGRFEMAEGGTLFLDEIGDMSLAMQVKLLRVLQERTFERVGSNKMMTANVRIIAATHMNLEDAVKVGKFREDLFYRLNVFPIDMPPLRDRIEDIPLLINELITRIEREKRGSVRLTPAAVLALCQYPWMGNVRELANLIERLAILYPHGVVAVGDLPEKYRMDGVLTKELAALSAEALSLPDKVVPKVPDTARLPRTGIDLKEHIKNLEMALIQQALDETDGVVSRAAARLKLRRTTLVEKLRKYGMQRAARDLESMPAGSVELN